MSDNFNKNRIIKNSILLYVRMLFTMWLNLYATRLVLANLGVDDMGVYGVVGGIVNLVAVFTGGITNAVQRFITFELGKKDGEPNKVFCSSLNVIFILSAFVFLLLETAGNWMLFYKVDIPEGSMDAAFWVFQLSILTCIVNLISIPYNALVIAHEKMGAFASISILQVILNFAAAYCITYFDDRLLWYGILMAVASIAIRLIYQVYCHAKFDESKYRFLIDRGMLTQIGKFAGVTTGSGILQTISSQGIVFVINWTFGVSLNAVYNIALQLKNAILSFAFNIFKAISPQITKTYASGEIETHTKLVYAGAKAEAFMIYFIMIPFLFRTEYIMKLWLGTVPPYAVEFAQATVFLSLTYALFEPIRTSVLATNRITKFMLYPELFYLLVLPVGYTVSFMTSSPVMLIVTIVGIDILTCVIRTLYAIRVCPVTIEGVFRHSIFPSVVVAVITSLVCYGLTKNTDDDIIGLLTLLFVNSVSLCVIIVFCGTNNEEKKTSKIFLRKLLKK